MNDIIFWTGPNFTQRFPWHNRYHMGVARWRVDQVWPS